MEIGGARWFLPRGKHHSSCSMFHLVCRPVPPERLLIFSDNIALAQALCKGRSTKSYIAFGHASYLCIWLHGRFCLIVRVDTVRIEFSGKGSSFFHRDFFPSKSILHVLAKRLTRTSPSRTRDRDCSSLSPMHLDGGQVDFRPPTRALCECTIW